MSVFTYSLRGFILLANSIWAASGWTYPGPCLAVACWAPPRWGDIILLRLTPSLSGSYSIIHTRIYRTDFCLLLLIRRQSMMMLYRFAAKEALQSVGSVRSLADEWQVLDRRDDDVKAVDVFPPVFLSGRRSVGEWYWWCWPFILLSRQAPRELRAMLIIVFIIRCQSLLDKCT